jgi:hypothetical protein
MQYDCYVTMEMHQTHCYTTGTITSLWKCNISHCYTTGTVTLLWKCHQGLIYHNILSFLWIHFQTSLLMYRGKNEAGSRHSWDSEATEMTGRGLDRNRQSRSAGSFVSYRRGPVLKPRLGDWLSWLRFIDVSSAPPFMCRNRTLNQVTTSSFHALSNVLFINKPATHHYTFSVAFEGIFLKKNAVNKAFTKELQKFTILLNILIRKNFLITKFL